MMGWCLVDGGGMRVLFCRRFTGWHGGDEVEAGCLREVQGGCEEERVHSIFVTLGVCSALYGGGGTAAGGGSARVVMVIVGGCRRWNYLSLLHSLN